MRIDVNDTRNNASPDYGFSLTDRVAYRMAAMGARVVACASQLRATGDLYSAQVAMRDAVGCANELDSVMELIEDGDATEASHRIERLAFPTGIRKP